MHNELSNLFAMFVHKGGDQELFTTKCLTNLFWVIWEQEHFIRKNIKIIFNNFHILSCSFYSQKFTKQSKFCQCKSHNIKMYKFNLWIAIIILLLKIKILVSQLIWKFCRFVRDNNIFWTLNLIKCSCQYCIGFEIGFATYLALNYQSAGCCI